MESISNPVKPNGISSIDGPDVVDDTAMTPVNADHEPAIDAGEADTTPLVLEVQ